MDPHAYWFEHEERSYVREKRRRSWAALAMGGLFLVITAVLWGWVPPDWFVAWWLLIQFWLAFCGAGLVVCGICELREARRIKAGMNRQLERGNV